MADGKNGDLFIRRIKNWGLTSLRRYGLAFTGGFLAFVLVNPSTTPPSHAPGRQPANEPNERSLGAVLRRTNDPRLARGPHPHPTPLFTASPPYRKQEDSWAGRNPGSPSLPPLADPCNDPYQWVCGGDGRRGGSRREDPTGSMSSGARGELFTLRILEEAFRNHDHEGSPERVKESIEDEAMRKIYVPSRTARIREGFKWVRAALIDFIEEQPEKTFSQSTKRILRRKLRDVRLELPPEVPYRDEPEIYTRNDAFYERLQNGNTRLRIGGAYLHSSKSWFNLVFTLSHELAHSIDPCELKALKMAPPSYDRLSACFLATGVVASHALRQECGETDQLSEAFADWVALQVTQRALESYRTEFRLPQLRAAAANAVADLCDEEESNEEHDDLTHPSPKIRIERIFGRNPQIREILGCPSLLLPPGPTLGRSRGSSAFCDFNWQPFDD